MTNADHAASPWYDLGWPVLTAVVAGCGIVAAYAGIGLLASIGVLAMIELTVAPTAWSILLELDRPGRPALLEIGPACALATLVAIGLVGWLGGWALPLLLLVLLSSPLLDRRRRGWLSSRYGSRRAETRRRFAEIVAHSLTPRDDEHRLPD